MNTDKESLNDKFNEWYKNAYCVDPKDVYPGTPAERLLESSRKAWTAGYTQGHDEGYDEGYVEAYG